MTLNYIITIDKGGSLEYYDLSLFRYLLSVPNSNLNRFINNIKDENDGVIKYGLINKLIKATIDTAPQFNITRHNIRYMQAKLAKEAEQKVAKLATEVEQKVVTPGCN